MSSVEPEAVAARSLRDYLLRTLPAEIATLNAARKAFLRAPLAGPYVVTSGMTLKVGQTVGTYTTVTPTTGSRTATQLASDINTAMGVTVATSDAQSRLLLTATAAPSSGSPSAMALGPDSTGANVLFGWDAGGNRAVSSALASPSFKGVSDGFPVTPEFAGGGAINIIIGDRNTVPTENVRSDMHHVELDLLVLRADPYLAVHASKEGIQASLRAVREVLLTDAGRRLDNPLNASGDGMVMLVAEVAAKVAGIPLKFDTMPTVLFDNASLRLRVKIYERAA